MRLGKTHGKGRERARAIFDGIVPLPCGLVGVPTLIIESLIFPQKDNHIIVNGLVATLKSSATANEPSVQTIGRYLGGT